MATTAHAEPGAVSWSISGPASCATDVERVRAEMALACGAAGGCRLGAPAETTDRRAIVTCGAEAWTIAARSDDGELWTMRLDGSAADRARKAAMWLARSEHDRPQSPPVEVAPAPPDTSAAVHIAPSAHGAGEGGESLAGPKHRDLATAAEAMLFPSQHAFRAGTQTFGIGGALAFKIGGGFSVGPALAFLRGDLHDDGTSRALTILRPAARLSWGAPTTDGIFGVSIDVGNWVMFGGSTVGVVQYLEPSFVAQWPHGELRPFLALTGMAGFSQPDELKKHASEAFGPFGVGLAAGISWSAR